MRNGFPTTTIHGQWMPVQLGIISYNTCLDSLIKKILYSHIHLHIKVSLKERLQNKIHACRVDNTLFILQEYLYNSSLKVLKLLNRGGKNHTTKQTNKEKPNPQTSKQKKTNNTLKNPQNAWKGRKKFKVEVSFMTLIHLHFILTREC